MTRTPRSARARRIGRMKRKWLGLTWHATDRRCRCRESDRKCLPLVFVALASLCPESCFMAKHSNRETMPFMDLSWACMQHKNLKLLAKAQWWSMMQNAREIACGTQRNQAQDISRNCVNIIKHLFASICYKCGQCSCLPGMFLSESLPGS